jgi:hypothetical protein
VPQTTLMKLGWIFILAQASFLLMHTLITKYYKLCPVIVPRKLCALPLSVAAEHSVHYFGDYFSYILVYLQGLSLGSQKFCGTPYPPQKGDLFLFFASLPSRASERLNLGISDSGHVWKIPDIFG